LILKRHGEEFILGLTFQRMRSKLMKPYENMDEQETSGALSWMKIHDRFFAFFEIFYTELFFVWKKFFR